MSTIKVPVDPSNDEPEALAPPPPEPMRNPFRVAGMSREAERAIALRVREQVAREGYERVVKKRE